MTALRESVLRIEASLEPYQAMFSEFIKHAHEYQKQIKEIQSSIQPFVRYISEQQQVVDELYKNLSKPIQEIQKAWSSIDFGRVLESVRQLEGNMKKNTWPMVELGSVTQIIGGGTPSKEKMEYWIGGAVKWLSAKYISNEMKIVGHDLITQKAVQESSTKIAPKNSVILITRVSVGKFAFADDDYAINQDLTAVIPNEKLNPRFLYIISADLAKKIEKNAQGVGVRGVTRDFIQKLKIPLPLLRYKKNLLRN
jgi:hypothetical protein